MAWIYLLIAGIFEIGWPLGLKLAHNSDIKLFWILFAVIAMALSGFLLYLAQRDIPIGIAYIVWTSIGAVGTFIVGVAAFGDVLSLAKTFAVLLILSGVAILKLSH